MLAKHHALALAAAFAAALLAAPAIAQPEVTPLTIHKAPTSVRVSIVGKTRPMVHREVRSAAYTVCRNARANRDLALEDVSWCRNRAEGKAMARYDAIVRRSEFADAGLILLSAR